MQRFQGGVKIGSTYSPPRRLQTRAAYAHFGGLVRGRARPSPSELAFPPGAFTVRVPPTMLMDTGTPLGGGKMVRQPARRIVAERRRNDREIEGQPTRSVQVEQRRQALVPPTNVVAAEEERSWSRKHVERPTDWVAPTGHAASGPKYRSATVISAPFHCLSLITRDPDTYCGAATAVSIRSESIVLTLAGIPVVDGHDRLEGTVRAASFLGDTIRYEVEVAGETIKVMVPPETTLERGAQLAITSPYAAAVARAEEGAARAA